MVVSKNKSWWFWLALLILVLAAVIWAGYRWATAEVIPQMSPTSPDYAPQYRFESYLPGISLTSAPDANDWMANVLEQFAYPQPLVFAALLDTGVEHLQPRQIVFEFAPINDLNPAERNQLKFKVESVGEVVAGIRDYYDGRSLTYTILLDTELLPTDDQDMAASLTYHLLRALYAGLPAPSQPETLDRIWQTVRQSQSWPFDVGQEQSLLLRLHDLLIPQAFAQYCSGIVECGEQRYDCACSGSKTKCDSSGATCYSPASGTCECKTGCYMFDCNDCGADSSCLEL